MPHVQFVRRCPACELAAKIENHVSKVTHRISPTFTPDTSQSDVYPLAAISRLRRPTAIRVPAAFDRFDARCVSTRLEQARARTGHPQSRLLRYKTGQADFLLIAPADKSAISTDHCGRACKDRRHFPTRLLVFQFGRARRSATSKTLPSLRLHPSRWHCATSLAFFAAASCSRIR
jgi:hypothetical protein